MSTFWTIVTAILTAEAILMVIEIVIDLARDRGRKARLESILAEWADECDCDYDEPVKPKRK
jgi:hypothetical protein